MHALTHSRRCLSLVFICFTMLCTVAPPALNAQDDGNMVALVNGAIIYQKDLDKALIRYYHPLGGMPVTTAGTTTESIKDPHNVKQQLLENLIDRELLIQEAQRQGMTISTARVLRRMERLPDALRPKANASKSAAASVSDTSSKGDTVRESSLFRYVHEGLLIERLLEKQLPKVSSISEKRARAYYEENPDLFMHPEEIHLRHILIQAPPEMAPEMRQQAYLKIQAIEQQLTEGATFTVLAIDASQCPSSARGGDLGYLTRQQLYPSLAQAAFDLVPGQMSPIIESPVGYHILLLTDRRPARQMTFLLVRDNLQKQLRTERLHKSARHFIRKLRDQAAIERLLR